MKSNTILQGDALTKLKELPEKSINMCMTSPPYWALRDYGTATWEGGDENCDHLPSNIITTAIVGNTKKGIGRQPFKDVCGKCGAKRIDKQLGLEPTFDEYINKLCDIFDGVKRVLRDDGTCWVNIGDTYYGSGKGAGGDSDKSKESYQMPTDWKRPSRDNYNKMSASKECLFCGKDIRKGITSQFCNHICLNKMGNDFRSQNRQLPDKCLTMIPMRFAIEMVNRGWILRNTIIWHKRNAMPSSAKDRFTVDFEYMFFFSKKKKYYFETQYEPLSDITINDIQKRKNLKCITGEKGSKEFNADTPIYQVPKKNRLRTDFINLEKGRNKRTTWTINPKPFKEAHFAVYPEELCETPIKAGCPKFVCEKCGNPREEIIKSLGENDYSNSSEYKRQIDEKHKLQKFNRNSHKMETTKKENLGLSDCGCNAGFTSGIVLDPFFGAGTTGVVALKQSKKFIGIELNKEYIEIANKRLKPYLEQRKLSF